MQLKSNSSGITLVELIIAVSLLTVVLFSAYFFLSFSTHSMNNTEAEFDAGQDARMAVIYMEEDIRKAQAVNLSGVHYEAVKVTAYGMSLNMCTNNDGTLQLVQYKIEDDKLKRGEANLGDTPTTWTTIADRVKNAMFTPTVPIFSLSGKLIEINLLVLDEKDFLLDNPIVVDTCFAVRSEGEIDR